LAVCRFSGAADLNAKINKSRSARVDREAHPRPIMSIVGQRAVPGLATMQKSLHIFRVATDLKGNGVRRSTAQGQT
jgi:hypothetical protein